MDTWQRWLCPTDRQLALRSRMQRGWTNLHNRPPTDATEGDGDHCRCALSADEMSAIACVMRDNERLLAVERRRVCHSIAKLEALKSVACGDGKHHCHLCGEKLGGVIEFPWTVQPQCNRCGLVTCSKCGTKSNKKSAAASEADQAAATGTRVTPWKCLYTRKKQPEDWECKICHKEVQLWKKSGAWLNKRLPPHEYVSRVEITENEKGHSQDTVASCNCGSGEGNGLASGRAAAVRYGATATPERRPDAAAAVGGQPAAPSPAAEFHDRGLGTLHFVLQYIPAKAALYIRIIKGEGLRAYDANGLSDPYVKMHLLPDTGKRTKLRTRTCQRTLNPVWDEEFCYSGVTKTEMAAKMLRLSVLDEDTIGFDWMGEILYPLEHLLQHGRKEYSEVFLQPKNFELDRSLKLEEDDRGKIMIGLYYAPAKNELAVRVIQCVNLIAMDPNGYSDPFVKLHLKPDDGTPKKTKTEVKRRTLNPDFDEEFYFIVTPQELPHKTLEITVWDKDFGTKNDFMGALALGNQCDGERWVHWEVLLRQPYQRHDRWHALCSELFLSERPADAK